MLQSFEVGIEIHGDGSAALYNSLDGTKELVVPVMATAFEQAIRARDKSAIEAFEILQSVCLSVIQMMPDLQARVSDKTFKGSDHFPKR